MTFSDWRKFETQRIARHYETSVRDYQTVAAELSKLELWAPQDPLLQTEHATSPDQRIATQFVSTLAE